MAFSTSTPDVKPLKIQSYFKPSASLTAVKAAHCMREDIPDQSSQVAISGRIIGRRKASANLLFLDLEANGETLQVMIDNSKLQRNGDADAGNDTDLIKSVALSCHRGAIVGIEGHPGRTQAGEFSIIAEKVSPLAECPKNLPMMNWNHKKTLKDGEKRFQQRYLDLVVNAELKAFFKRRAQIVRFLRDYLDQRDFLEVETPILNAQAGGALAKPFLTKSEELQMDLELRIAPELFLKQLVIGGFDRVFEVGKVFRNEGIDSTHNPEFSTLEFYMAYADYHDLMEMTEDMLRSLLVSVHGSATPEVPIFEIDAKTVTRGGNASIDVETPTSEQKTRKLDFEGNFHRYDVMEELGLDPLDLGDLDKLRPKLRSMLIEGSNLQDGIVQDMNDKQLFDKLIESRIEVKAKDKPVFIMNHPLIMSPLAKSHAQGRSRDSRGAQYLAERFELFVHGMELVNAYSEQNNAQEQAKAFQTQSQFQGNQDEELHRNDQDFIEALEYGMPPTAGWGCGIDRLSMLLCGAKNIREVILFPMHRTSVLGQSKKTKKQKRSQTQ